MIPDDALTYLAGIALFGYAVAACDARSATTRYRARSWPGGLCAGVGFVVMVTSLLGWR